jgi:hypothetical protein
MKRKNRKIQFMLEEAVNTEYRKLKTLQGHSDPDINLFAESLEFYTPGNEELSAYRFNPFDRIKGISVEEHIENLFSCFMATMPVSGPLPALIFEALEKVYQDFPDPDWPPTMLDFLKAINDVLDSKGYSPETNSDIRTAIAVRIGRLTRGSIGRVFQCRRSVPDIEHLIKVPVIFESNSLSADPARILMLFKLTQVRELYKVSPHLRKNTLNYVIVLEEAHVILGRVGDSAPSEDNPDVRAQITEFFCRMMAELRGLGICIIIVDQLPTAIASQVIKITSSKLAFRQVADQDRQQIGGTMLFGDIEMEDIARLEPAEAFFITEGFFRSRRIRTVNLYEIFDLDRSLSDQELLAIIEKQQWFIDARIKRVSTELDQFKVYMDDFDQKKKDIFEKTKKILQQYERLLKQKDIRFKEKHLDAILGDLCIQRKKLIDSYKEFIDGPYRLFSYLLNGKNNHRQNDLTALAKSLNNRYETVIRDGTRRLLGLIDKQIENCKKIKMKGLYYEKKKKN